MAETWERDNLAANINSLFRVTTGNGRTLDLELISVSGLLETDKQRTFSVIFLGPVDISVGQGTYRIEHNKLETADVFIVPVARNNKGVEYEAVFNRLK